MKDTMNSFIKWLLSMNSNVYFTNIKQQTVAQCMIMYVFTLSNGKQFVIVDDVYVSYDGGFYLYTAKDDELWNQLRFFTTHVHENNLLHPRLWILDVKKGAL